MSRGRISYGTGFERVPEQEAQRLRATVAYVVIPYHKDGHWGLPEAVYLDRDKAMQRIKSMGLNAPFGPYIVREVAFHG